MTNPAWRETERRDGIKEHTSSFTQKYRFGFNNQEQETELGEYYSFEYRVHDARLGRFLSVDPLAPEYPFYSSYQFAGNQVVWAIDIEGLEPYIVTHRSFAPWNKFGNFRKKGERDFYGDNRGFSLCSNTIYKNYQNEVSSRVFQSAYIDILDNNSIKINTLQTHCSITRKVPLNNDNEKSAYGQPAEYIRNKGGKVQLRFEASNPLVNPSPDIDWTLKLNLTKKTYGNENYIQIEASVNGKGFPAYESFITDSKGTSIFLFTLESPKRDKLEEELLFYPLDDRKASANIEIETNEKGEFTNNIKTFHVNEIKKGWFLWKKTIGKIYVYNEKSYTIQEWNNMMGYKKAAPDLEQNEGIGGKQCLK